MAEQDKTTETKTERTYNQTDVDNIVAKALAKSNQEWKSKNEALNEKIVDLTAKARLGKFASSWEKNGGNAKALTSFINEFKDDLPEKDEDFDDFIKEIRKSGEKDYYFNPKVNIAQDLTIKQAPKEKTPEKEKTDEFYAGSSIKKPKSINEL